jgi:signal transduction histidine kinase
MEEGDMPRRSKRVLSSPKCFKPPVPPTRQKRLRQLVTKRRRRGNKISKSQPLLGGGTPATAALSYQQILGSTTPAVGTTLNTPETPTSDSRATRTRQDLENAVPRIICREFDDNMAADMREDVQSLREELMTAARHRGILPLSLRDTLSKLLKKWDQDYAYFGEYPRSKEEENNIWMAIQDIRVNAKMCGEQNKPESSWLHEVIRPLIENAIKYTPWQNRVRVEIV